jgi:hypothetical protein
MRCRKYRISEEDSKALGGGAAVTAPSYQHVKREKWYRATTFFARAATTMAGMTALRQPEIDAAASPDFDLARARAGFSRAGR